MIEAGSETTSQALNNTIVGLLQNPEAVRKAHEELDRVVGTDRTPTFDDEDNLPYIRAIIKVPYSNHALLTCRKPFGGEQSTRWDKTISSFKMIGMRAISSPRTPSS
jgi:hypothetical protein